MMWKLIVIASCFTQLLADRRGGLVDVGVKIGGGGSGEGGIGGVLGAAGGIVNDAGNIVRGTVRGAGNIASGAVAGVGGIANTAVRGAVKIAGGAVRGAGNVAGAALRGGSMERRGRYGSMERRGRYGSMERRGRYGSMERRGARPSYVQGNPASAVPYTLQLDQDLEELAELKEKESYRHQYQKSALVPLALELVSEILDNPGNVGNTIVETVLTGKKKDVAPNTAAASRCITSVRNAVSIRRYNGETDMENTPVSEVMEKECTKDCKPVMDLVPREVLDGIMCTSKNILSKIMPYAEEADQDSYEDFYHPIGLGFLNTLLGGLLGGITKTVTDTANTVTGTVLNTATGAVNKALKTGAGLVDSTAGTALGAADKAVKTVGGVAGKAVNTVAGVADKAVNTVGGVADAALGAKVGKAGVRAAAAF